MKKRILIVLSFSILFSTTVFAGWQEAAQQWQKARVTVNQTQPIKATGGILHSVSINTKGAASNTLTLYDDTVATDPMKSICTIDTTASVGTILYDIQFTNGLTAKSATGTAADVTIIYN